MLKMFLNFTIINFIFNGMIGIATKFERNISAAIF